MKHVREFKGGERRFRSGGQVNVGGEASRKRRHSSRSDEMAMCNRSWTDLSGDKITW